MTNTQPQIPNTKEVSNARVARDISVAFGIWDFFGVWRLVFAVFEARAV